MTDLSEFEGCCTRKITDGCLRPRRRLSRGERGTQIWAEHAKLEQRSVADRRGSGRVPNEPVAVVAEGHAPVTAPAASRASVRRAVMSRPVLETWSLWSNWIGLTGRRNRLSFIFWSFVGLVGISEPLPGPYHGKFPQKHTPSVQKKKTNHSKDSKFIQKQVILPYFKSAYAWKNQ